MGDVCDSTSCAIMRCSKLRRLVEGSVEGEDLGGMAAKVQGGGGTERTGRGFEGGEAMPAKGMR